MKLKIRWRFDIRDRTWIVTYPDGASGGFPGSVDGIESVLVIPEVWESMRKGHA